MDDKDILARVEAEGLERAWAHFPDAMREAARLAARQGQALRAGLSPADEPWPPMRKGHGP